MTSKALSNVFKLRDVVNVKDPAFGAKGSGAVNDDVAAQLAITTLANAAGGLVFFPHGRYPLGARLDVADNSYIHLQGEGYGSVLEKNFNGDMISLGLKGEMSELRLDGKGATRTGRGVIISTGGGGDGWQNIHDCTILDTASACIEYTASGAGWMSRIVSNRLDTYDGTTYSVKYPTADSNGPRTLANNVSLGPLADLAGAAGVTVVGNNAGEGPFSGPKTVGSITMNDDLFKAVVQGNSFDSAISLTIKGESGTWTGNTLNGGYTVGAGAVYNKIANNNGSGGVAVFDTDNSGNVSNEIWGFNHGYTPTWTSSGVAPAYGASTATGRYQRQGRSVSLHIDIIFAGATFGTGAYTFGLPPGIPAPGSGDGVISGLLVDATGSIYTAIGFVTNTGVSIYVSAAAGVVTEANPVVWANGDRFILSGTYTI